MNRRATGSGAGILFFLAATAALLLVVWLFERLPPAAHEPEAGASVAVLPRAPLAPSQPPTPAAPAATAAPERPQPGAAPAATAAASGWAGIPATPAEARPPAAVRVVGRIVDDDGAAVAGAAVDVVALGRGTWSDASGRFQLLLPPGEHALRVWRLDHDVREQRLLVPADAGRLAVEIQLHRQAFQLEPVLVLAPRHRRREAVRPGHHVLLAEDVQRRIGGFEDIMRSVQALPSVGSASDFHGEFFVHGAGTHANTVYLDGIPIFFPYHILGFNSIFNPGIVESAEFFAGGAPAAYGGGTGGVLLVRSHGERPPERRGDAGVSYVSAHFRAAGGDATRGWALSLRRSYHDQVVRLVDPTSTSHLPSFYDAMLRGRWRPGERHLLVGGLLLAGDGLSIPSPEASAIRHDFVRDDPGAGGATSPLSGSSDRLSLRNRVAVGSLTWRALLGSTAWLETVCGYVPQRLQFALQGENDESVFIESATLSWRQDLVWQRAAHRLRFGYEGYHARTDGAVSAYAAFLDLRQSNAALNVVDQKERYVLDLNKSRTVTAFHAEDDWALARGQLALRAGLRYEHDGLTGQDLLSPRLSVSLHPEAVWSLHGSLGVFHALRSTPLEVQPSSDGSPLAAERAGEATLGVTRRGRALQAGLSGYVKRLDNLVYESEPAYYTNGGRGRSHGAETWLEFAPLGSVFSARGQYAWSRSEQLDGNAWRRRFHLDPDTGESVWGAVYEAPGWYSPMQDQRHRVALDARLALGAWEFATHLQLASGLSYTPIASVEVDAEGTSYGIVGAKGSARLPLYQRLDVRLLRHFRSSSVHWRLFAEVLNVTAAENVYMQRWNRDYTQQYSVTMMPLLPTLGIEASF